VRRFITSLPGKVISQLVILTLILPSITLALFAKANAQIAVLPSWAVTEFTNKVSSGTSYGKAAADAFASELAKTGQFDVTPSDTVKRATETLGISSPPDGLTNLLRLAGELHCTSIVKGDLVSYKVYPAGGGRQASVVMKVLVYDSASGLPVNGAALKGVSAIRSGNATDESLINDAIEQAAGASIREINAHRLPVGTVLNTQDKKALINKGARSGFQPGQEVIVLRGGEQVATAKVTDVEPDSSYIVTTKIIRGIQPGDKIRVVFNVPDVDVDTKGDPHIHPARSTAFPSGLVSVVLVLGLVAALVGGGNGGTQNTVQNVASQAMMTPNSAGLPAVYISWSNTVFAGGVSQRAAWQIYRQDVVDSPVGVSAGYQGSFMDTTAGQAIGALSYAVFPLNQIGNSQNCNYTSATDTTNAAAVPGIIPGTQYNYQVQEVYDLLAIDLPNGGTSQTSGSSSGSISGSSGSISGSSGSISGSSGSISGSSGSISGSSGSISGSSGSISGSSGSTSSTASTSSTGSTSTSGTTGQYCFFLTSKVSAVGIATPLNPPVLQSPADNQPVSGTAATIFTTNSVQGPQQRITAEYVLEFSTSPVFAKGQTFVAAKFISNAAGVVGTPGAGVNPGAFFPNANSTTVIHWRYGAKNVADSPGPVPDQLTGEHYIFCPYRSFTLTGTPPPPPSAATKAKTVKVGAIGKKKG